MKFEKEKEMIREGFFTTDEAIAELHTNRSTFLRAVVFLKIPNIKFPNDKHRYFRPEHVEQIRANIYKNKEVVTDSPQQLAA
jgi:hypothetical protein